MEIVNEGRGPMTPPECQTNRDWAIVMGKSLKEALDMAGRECGEGADALAEWLDAPHVPTSAEAADCLYGMAEEADHGGEIDLTYADRAAIAIALIEMRVTIDAMQRVADHLEDGKEVLLKDGCEDIRAMAAFMRVAHKTGRRAAG